MPTIIVFGVKPAPFVFTKIMRPVIGFARLLGVNGTNCIDDNLWAGAQEDMPRVVEFVQLLFGTIGWVFNSKCVFTPGPVALYNGMWIDTQRYEIRAPDDKWETTRKLAWALWLRARDGLQVSVKDLQRLAGRLHSIKLATEGVAVWTRGLYADIERAIDSYRRDGVGPGYAPAGAQTYLRDMALEDLWFWAHA
jgi:hypothetical protein